MTRCIRKGSWARREARFSTSLLITCRYVEMLEQQQAQLVAGLQELYRRTIDGTGWPGAPLKHAGQSQPLTHDILDRLGALTTERPGDPETFEENLDVLQHRLFQEGARPVSRHGSPSTEESAHSHSPSSPHDVTMPQNILFGNQIDMTDAPPTPSTISPTSQVSTEPMDFRLRSQFVPPIFTQANLDPMQLQQPNWPVNYRQKLDTSMNLDEQTAGHFLSGQSAGPCLVPDWNEDEEFRAFLGQIAG